LTTVSRPPQSGSKLPHSKVAVTSRRRLLGVRAADVRRDATALLRLLAIDAELSVALVDDSEIRRLNSTYRRVDKPTDVLAFAMREGDGAALHPDVLGDVVISLDTAARQAAGRGVPVADEVRLLLTHGLLHLLGYDHERSPAEARRMFRKQRALVSRL
jgi:probable rRNA maturation factor